MMLVYYYLALCIFNCSDRAGWLVLTLLFKLFIASVFHISSSWIPYSDHAFYLACLITYLHASLADRYCYLFCGVGSFSHILYTCFFNFVAYLVSSFQHAVAFFCCPPDAFCPTIFSAIPCIISLKYIHSVSAESNLFGSCASW